MRQKCRKLCLNSWKHVKNSLSRSREEETRCPSCFIMFIINRQLITDHIWPQTHLRRYMNFSSEARLASTVTDRNRGSTRWNTRDTSTETPTDSPTDSSVRPGEQRPVRLEGKPPVRHSRAGSSSSSGSVFMVFGLWNTCGRKHFHTSCSASSATSHQSRNTSGTGTSRWGLQHDRTGENREAWMKRTGWALCEAAGAEQ